MLWTKEKIAGLSLADLKSLSENAKARSNNEVVSLCEAELETRKPKASSRFQLPEGFTKIVKTSVEKKLESDVDELLVKFANELIAIYDFSVSKATELSEGTKGFKAHELLNGKGVSKVGAAQTVGLVAFDRFISYRVKDEAFALLCLLPNAHDADGVRYQVFGPKRLLDKFIPLDELRPYPLTEVNIGIYTGGEAYLSFQEAANRYRWLIDQVAPKR